MCLNQLTAVRALPYSSVRALKKGAHYTRDNRSKLSLHGNAGQRRFRHTFYVKNINFRFQESSSAKGHSFSSTVLFLLLFLIVCFPPIDGVEG